MSGVGCGFRRLVFLVLELVLELGFEFAFAFVEVGSERRRSGRVIDDCSSVKAVMDQLSIGSNIAFDLLVAGPIVSVHYDAQRLQQRFDPAESPMCLH